MAPTPTPAPPIPMQAIPAPMYFAACGSMGRTPFGVSRKGIGLVARVNRIVEIDASEDRENIGLQATPQKLERSQRHRERKRQQRADPAGDADAAHERHEGA